MLQNHAKNFYKEFQVFSKKNNLFIYDLYLKPKKINEIFKSLNSIDAKQETIGDYIISNYKLTK